MRLGLAFPVEKRKVHPMIAVETDEKEIRITIPTHGMPAAAISRFVAWLKLEATAQRSRLTEEDAWKLSEEIKSDWWTRNQSRFPGKDE